MNYFLSLLEGGRFFDDMFYSGIVLVISLILLLIPLSAQSFITVPFSFRTFGIRKIRRWHSRTDTLANLMLWISIFFCVGAAWIPYAPIIYLVWLTFTWLCTVSRAIRLTKVTSKGKKLTVIFLINLLYGIGVLSTLGFYNSYSLWIRAFMFANDIVSGEGMRFMYYLNSVQPGAWLLQTILLLLPVTVLWGQFKYMRLENTFKASNLGFYVIKMLLLCAIMAVMAIVGPAGLEKIYNLPSEERISVDSKVYPLDREEMLQILNDTDDEKKTPSENTDSSSAPSSAEEEQKPKWHQPGQSEAPQSDPNPEEVDPEAVEYDEPPVPAIDPEEPVDSYTEPVGV